MNIWNVGSKYKKMNIGNLIFTLPARQKTLVRKTEKENKKIANTESSLVYNTTYLFNMHLSNSYFRCNKSYKTCPVKGTITISFLFENELFF